MDSDCSDSTDDVAEFYSRLKYPGPQTLVSHGWASRLTKAGIGDSFRFIDAGCGTGSITAGILQKFPRAEAVLMDISQPSLDAAKQLMDSLGLVDRCRFIQASYYDSPPNIDEVDLVLAVGTVHHTPDIGVSIANLCTILRSDGVFAGMIYNSRSAETRYNLRKAFDILLSKTEVTVENVYPLWESWNNQSNQIKHQTISQLANRMSFKASQLKRAVLRQPPPRQQHATGLTYIADSFFAPIDQAIDSFELQAFFESCNLDIITIFGCDQTTLPDSWRTAWLALPKWQQVHVWGLVNRNPNGWSFLARKIA